MMAVIILLSHTKKNLGKEKKTVINQENIEQETKAKEIYNSCNERTKKEKLNKTINEVNKEINDIEKSKEIVTKVIEKENRNRIVRNTRLYRKLGLQQWNYFCTFTYDSNKLSEEEFKIKLLTCLRHLASRKNWRYIGAWEISPNTRLHFHGIFVITEMVGEIIQTKDYSTKTHQMQVTNQNTFFLERFGRNDFKPIIHNSAVSDAVRYILKYIRKTGEKIIYSRHLQTYFISDIIEDDIVCKIGQEDKKLLLFDNFHCLDEGEVIGRVSPEVIKKMPKAY